MRIFSENRVLYRKFEEAEILDLIDYLIGYLSDFFERMGIKELDSAQKIDEELKKESEMEALRRERWESEREKAIEIKELCGELIEKLNRIRNDLVEVKEIYSELREKRRGS